MDNREIAARVRLLETLVGDLLNALPLPDRDRFLDRVQNLHASDKGESLIAEE